jgi:hypothetical protein
VSEAFLSKVQAFPLTPNSFPQDSPDIAPHQERRKPRLATVHTL